MTRTTARNGRFVRAVLVAGLLTGLAASTVLAAPGGGKPGGGTTSTFVVPDGTFGGTTTARGGTGSWVHAVCYQNGSIAYEQWVRYGAAKTAVLTLGPTPSWYGGSATCIGQDGYFSNSRWRVNATDEFTVSG